METPKRPVPGNYHRLHRHPPNGYSEKSGKGRSIEFETWRGMRRRCYDENNISYYNYGGRGIRVCEAWQASYDQFLADMGRRPSPEHSLDRIDPDADYEPSNCRWATKKEQTDNRRPCYIKANELAELTQKAQLLERYIEKFGAL